MIESSSFCTPLLWNDEPQSIGTSDMLIVAVRMAAINSSGVIESGSSKNFSIRASSVAATSSISLARHSAASAFMLSGISLSTKLSRTVLSS